MTLRSLRLTIRVAAAMMVLAVVATSAGTAAAQTTAPGSPGTTGAPGTAAVSTTIPATDPNVMVTRGVEFGTMGSVPLRLDVYQPRQREDGRPAVVLIHGGSWQQGGADQMDVPGRLLAL